MRSLPPGFAPLPFVAGCSRSGTTLLRAMLDSPADPAMVHESRFIPDLARDRASSPIPLLR